MIDEKIDRTDVTCCLVGLRKVGGDADPGGHGGPPLRSGNSPQRRCIEACHNLCRGGPLWPPEFASATIYQMHEEGITWHKRHNPTKLALPHHHAGLR